MERCDALDERLEGQARPWSNLEPLLANLQVEQMLGGTVYVASGIVK